MSNIREEKRAMSKRLSLLVASTVFITQISSAITPVLAQNNDSLSVNVSQIEDVQAVKDEVYSVLFDGSEKVSWKTLVGGGIHENENGYLKITRDVNNNNEFVFFDENAPQIKDGEAEMIFKVDGDASRGSGRFGFAIRPQTDGTHLFVGYDLNGIWKIETKTGATSKGVETFNGPEIIKGQEYKLQVRYEGKKIDIYLDGKQIFSKTMTIDMPTDTSYGIGFKTWYGVNDSYVDHFKVGPIGSIITEEKKNITSIEEVNVDTYERVRPQLPTKVKVVYDDKTNGSEEVTWDSINSDSYKKEGVFKVNGTLVGRAKKVTATVTVKVAPDDGSVIVPPDVIVEEKELISGDMKVILDNNFPRVIRYEVDGEVLKGEEEQLFLVELNGDKYVPNVSFNQVDDKTAEYIMNFESLDLVMKMQMKLVKDNTLRMEVTDIIESGDFKVRSINFPDHNLATVKANENGKVSGVLTTGDWNNIKESFDDVSEMRIGSYKKTYGIINNDKFAIAIDNNVIEGGDRASINISDRDGDKQAGISNGTWTYRESMNSASAPTFNGKVGSIEVTGGNQVIISSDTAIKTFMNKEYDAVYCGLGGVEDFEGKDLTGKVAIVDRGTHTFVDKAKNAAAVGAKYIVVINNADGLVPEQGSQDTINAIGIDKSLGDKIKAELKENTIKVKFSINSGDVVPGEPEELPWSQIMISTDTNKNGKVTWQDAAVLYRENMKEVKGADYIKNSFSYIPFNIGSLAQSPFLRTGDMIKKLSNYTDGFAQLVLEKGYQGEGHDDVISDIGGHTGIRQGGKDDLNKLIDIGKDYNARVGVHINVTEYHLDAFQLKVENLKPGFQKGWAWKDNSYYVDQKKDVVSGELKRRFDMLKKDHPDLAWTYIDVYTGNGWNAHELAEIIQDNDWMVATEFNGPLEQQTAWTHWGGDPAYPNRGNESKIIRFLRNQEQDVFMSDDLLKGAKHMLSGGWGTRHDVEGFYAVETFYNQTLPSKYMQHFEIQEWEDDKAAGKGYVKFNDGVESRRENGSINMYKDGKLIATTDQSTIDDRGIGKTKLFIPWTWNQLGENPENKIYHWNPYGGETTWDIPTNWSGTQSVKIYELSDLGRTFVEEISVVNGKVTIDAKKNTPYVVFQEKVSEDRIDNWGEGTLIKDPGFDSQTLDNWKVETTSENKDHINIVNEKVDRRMGNDALVIQGEVKPDETLIPQSQMTATSTNSQAGEEADKAIDGNANTLWHTSYSGVTGPQSITVNLGNKHEIDKVTCLPRQSGSNGKIKNYELQVSTDGTNFTKVSEGKWDESSDLKIIKFNKTEATHIRLIAKEYIGAFVSLAELNVHMAKENAGEDTTNQGGKDAKISQEINGLESGKTYTASVWVKSDGDREITFGVDCGGKNTTSAINRATTRTNVGEGAKWYGEKISRMRVDFTVPEGATTAKLYVDVAKSDEDTKVMIDDFRIWTNPLGSNPTNKDEYVLYDDFENVDEGHGPLYMGQNLGTDNRTHFAEKNPDGGQYMNWVIDGRFSLKTNQQEGTTGEMLLTDESTLKLEPNKTYELGFKYTNKVDNLYSVSIKSKTAGVLFNDNLIPGVVVGKPEDGPEYSREVKEFKKIFTTGDAVDYYLSFNKGSGFDELVLDDLYIKEVKENIKEALQSVIVEADKLVEKEYTVESWKIFSDTLKSAKAVNENSEATQEEVDAAKASLEAAIDTLVLNTFNKHIEIAIEEAEKVTESELSKVVPVVVDEFKLALKEAKELLANPKATQEQLNNSFERLSKAMHMLSFEKGNKEYLTSLVERVSKLNKEDFIADTWNKMEISLGEANKVINDKNAMEKEVNESYTSLLKAFLDLRLKPSKDKLEDLINKAESLNESDYTENSWSLLGSALSLAKSVFSNEDATKEEIAKAGEDLESAINELVKNDTNAGNGGTTGSGGSSNGNSSGSSNGGKNNGGKLPSTGGTSSAAFGLFGTLLATAGAFIKRRKNK